MSSIHATFRKSSPSPKLAYIYSLWPLHKHAYEIAHTRMYHKPVENDRWNYRDSYISFCGMASREGFELQEVWNVEMELVNWSGLIKTRFKSVSWFILCFSRFFFSSQFFFFFSSSLFYPDFTDFPVIFSNLPYFSPIFFPIFLLKRGECC